MPSLPADWITRSLTAINAGLTDQAITVMRAWQQSTPLPPMANNPVGMPRGTGGAPSYLGTPYAIFPSMQAFYSALSSFGRTYQGGRLAESLNDSGGYPAAWRAISSLGWPGSDTETDYPSAVLDLSSAAYVESITGGGAGARATSGTVGGSKDAAPSAGSQVSVVNAAVSSARAAFRAAQLPR